MRQIKTLLGTVLVYGFICYGVTFFDGWKKEKSNLLLENVEALTAGEDQYEAHCEGNTGTCAKGVNENTGNTFIIHGRVVFD